MRNLVRLTWLAALTSIFLIASPMPRLFAQEEGEDPDAPEAADGSDLSPTGVSGAFSGLITTGCSYDPWTRNFRRAVDDIVVPGTVSAYPLKFTRTYNSRDLQNWEATALIYGALGNSMGRGWRHSYSMSKGNWNNNAPFQDNWKEASGFVFPDGRVIPYDFNVACPPEPPSIEETWDEESQIWTMADGGKVHLGPGWGHTGAQAFGSADEITDPYGQKTMIEHDPSYTGQNRITRVVDVGSGKSLVFEYYPAAQGNLIKRVEAHDENDDSMGLAADYTYSIINGYRVLTQVHYSDDTTATYHWTSSGNSNNQLFIDTADDPHLAGPMHHMEYYRQNGVVNGEWHSSTIPVSTIDTNSGAGHRTEARGDGKTRSFTYVVDYDARCDTGHNIIPVAHGLHGYLTDFTDFEGNPTHIDYYAEEGDPPASYRFIKAVTDANNNRTEYVRGYSESWAITKIIYDDGSFIEQEFTDHANPYYLASRTALRGPNDTEAYTTTYTRDGNHRITEIQYPDGSTEGFDYNEVGQVTRHRMKNGAYVHFTYSTDGRHLLLEKSIPTFHDTLQINDARTSYLYYPDDLAHTVEWTARVYQETDPREITTTYEYDRALDGGGLTTGDPVAGRGLITKIIHPGGAYQSFAYDQYGDKRWERNEVGQFTYYEYDEYGRVKNVKTPLPGGQQATTSYDYAPATPNPTSTSSYCHTTNNPKTVTSPALVVTTNTYDKNWRKLSVMVGSGAEAATTSFQYDGVGNQTYVYDPRTNPTHTEYDFLNRPWRVTDAANHVTWTEFDTRGRVKKVHRSDGTVEEKDYDNMDRVLTDTVPKNASESVTTTFEYYGSNDLPNGQSRGLLKKVTDGESHSTTFQYDAAGMKTAMIYPNNTDTQTWTYDPNHNLIARKTVNGVAQLFSYDDRNRQIAMAWSNAADWATFGYDDVGRLTSAVNPTSTITRAYDEGGRMKLDRQQLHVVPISAVSRKAHGAAGTFDVTLPLVGNTGVECRKGTGTNSNEHQIIVTFSRAVTFSPVEVTSGTASISNTGTSTDGKQVTINLTGVTNAQTIVLTMPSLTDGIATNNVVVGMTALYGDTTANGTVNSSDVAQVSGQSGQAVTTSNFRQDVNLSGSISSSDIGIVSSKVGTSATLVSLTQPASNSPNIDVEYEYYADGAQKRLFVTSAGYDYTFGYDSLRRFQTISQNSTVKFQYSYDTTSNVTHRTNNLNGVDQDYGTPDSLNRMVQRDVKLGTTVISHEAYGYDPQRPGLMTSVTRNFAPNQTQDVFTYDLLPELTNAQYGIPASGPAQRTCGYTFDRAGNRLTMTDSVGPSHNYGTPTVLNQYLTDGTNPITSGSHHELANYQNVTYAYINDTHLSQVSGVDLFANQSTYQMAYDALGRCAVRVLNGVTTSYIYDGEKAILEYHSWSSPSAMNLYGRGIDEILMRTDASVNNGQPFYYQDDHQGSVTHLTNASGAVIESYRYDAFGKPTINGDPNVRTSAFGNRFMFTGREYVEKFGIYEYRNRAYHPGLGRFMSEDPKGFDAGDYNLFRYCHNDPLDLTDPMGLAPADQFEQKVAANSAAPPPEESQPSLSLHEQRSRGVRQIWNSPHHVVNSGTSLIYAAVEQTRSLEGTNSKLEIPKQTYDTGFAASKTKMDAAYVEAKDTKDREMTGPVGQVNGASKGGLFAGPYTPGLGKMTKGKYIGDQGSYIDDLTASLPKGSHLVGYYTVHIHRDPSRLRKIDAGNFEGYWGIPAQIWMKSPGRGGLGGNWEKPEYNSYPLKGW